MLRNLLLTFSLLIFVSCGGGGGNSSGSDGGKVESIKISKQYNQNWIAESSDNFSEMELTLEYREKGSNDYRVATAGDVYWNISEGGEYAQVTKRDGSRLGDLKALQACPEDNRECVTVSAEFVTGNDSFSTSIPIVVKPTDANLPPEADIGVSSVMIDGAYVSPNISKDTNGITITVDGDAQVTLSDNNSNDYDGDIVDWDWTVIRGNLSDEDITGRDTDTAIFDAPPSKYDQVIILQLTTTDNNSGISSKQITVQITPNLSNTAPIASILNLEDGQSFIVGQEIPLNGRFNDDDATAKSCQWSWSVNDPANGGELTPIGEKIADCEQKDSRISGDTFTPELESLPSDIYLVLEVTDRQDVVDRAIKRLTITPIPEGNPPITNLVLTVNPGDNEQIHQLSSTGTQELSLSLNEGENICLDLSASTLESAGNSLSYNWINTENLIANDPQTETKRCFTLPAKTEADSVSLLPGVTETYADKVLKSSVSFKITILPLPKLESITYAGRAAGENLPVTANTIELTFSDKMGCESLQDAFTITDTTAKTTIAHEIECNNKTIIFTTTSDELEYGHTYKASLKTSVKNTNGNDLTYEHGSELLTWNFNTASSPTVIISPADGDVDIQVNSAIDFTFSEDMDCTTIIANNIIISRDIPNTEEYEIISGSFVCPVDGDSKRATFNPGKYLQHSNAYNIVLTHATKTKDQNPIESSNTSVFTTIAKPEVAITTIGEGNVFVKEDTGQRAAESSEPINFEETLTLIATPKTGYHLKGISGCGGDQQESNFTTGKIKENCQVTVEFEIDTHTISAKMNTVGGQIAIDSTTVKHGGTVNFTISTEAGYEIGESSPSSNCTISSQPEIGNYQLVNVTDNCEITVDFDIKPIGISVETGNSSVSLTWSQPDNTYLRYDTCYYLASQAPVDLNDCLNQTNGATLVEYISQNQTITGLQNGTNYNFALLVKDVRLAESPVMGPLTNQYLPMYYKVSGTVRGNDGGDIFYNGETINIADTYIKEGEAPKFTIDPDRYYSVSGVTSNCSGEIEDSMATESITYQIEAINSDCEITAAFWKVTEKIEGIAKEKYFAIHKGKDDGNNDLLVAVGFNGQLSISADGEFWLRKQVGNMNLFSVYYHNGEWVAVGTDGYIAQSTDGYNWTYQQLKDGEANVWNSTNFNSVYGYGNKWLAVGVNGLMASRNVGETEWTVKEVGVGDWSAIKGNADQWVAVGTEGIAVLKNGSQEWDFQNIGGGSYNSDVYANPAGKWMVAGRGVYTWEPGEQEWSTEEVSGSNYRSVFYSNGNWVAVGLYGKVATYNEISASWSVETVGSGYEKVYANSNGDWFAGGRNDKTAIKRNGESDWAISEDMALADFVEFNDLLVAVGDDSVIMSSTDLSGWNSTRIGIPSNLNAVHSCNGNTVAVGNNGSVVMFQGPFEDVISPISKEIGSGTFKDIYCDGAYWAAVGDTLSNGVGIMTSTNGVSWKTYESRGYGYNSVYAINGSWKAVGREGYVASWDAGDSSPTLDEIYLRNPYSDDTTNFYDIYANDNCWIAVGWLRLQYEEWVGYGIFTLAEGESEWLSLWQTDEKHWATYYGNDYHSVHIDPDSGHSGVVGAAGIVYSEDGNSWMKKNTHEREFFSDIYSHKGKWMAVGLAISGDQNYGLVSLSVDGNIWKSQHVGLNKINEVLAEQDLWVTVGNDGQITSSLDGVNWIIHQSKTNNYHDVTYDSVNHQWIAVGQSGQVFSAVEPAH